VNDRILTVIFPKKKKINLTKDKKNKNKDHIVKIIYGKL
jgi:hypothetical protein